MLAMAAMFSFVTTKVFPFCFYFFESEHGVVFQVAMDPLDARTVVPGEELLYRIRSLFDEFDRNFALLHGDRSKDKHSGKVGGVQEVEVPQQSFEEKWNLKFGAASFGDERVQNMLWNHPFVYVKTARGNHAASYFWSHDGLSTVRDALLLFVAERCGASKGNACDLNLFQSLHSTIYGHPCVQLDIHQYLHRLGITMDADTLRLLLPEPTYYHIALPMERLSSISNRNLRAFGAETNCKVLHRGDIDPFDSSMGEVDIVSVLHRNVNGFYLKLTPLPTAIEPLSAQRVRAMLDSWSKRLCSKYLGHDIAATPIAHRELAVFEPLLALSRHSTADERLVRVLDSLLYFR